MQEILAEFEEYFEKYVVDFFDYQIFEEAGQILCFKISTGDVTKISIHDYSKATDKYALIAKYF